MKIVIAPDSFKESLSAVQVADEIEAGFRRVFPEALYLKRPVADGGEGTVAALVAATQGRLVAARVRGPLGEETQAYWGILGDGCTAVAEMASSCGLALIPPARRNPLQTTSYGFGELLHQVLDQGLRRLIIGIGGSATNDGGVGMLQALGVRFLDGQGREIGPGAAALEHLTRIDAAGLDARLRDCRLEVACDVDNPLLGPQGASQVFGPQKGATPQMVERLEGHLAHLARVVARDLHQDMTKIKGGGAAGGMGAALKVFLHAELRPGIAMISEAISLEEALAGADLVITGEGRMDAQTARGKAPVGVAALAVRRGVPVLGIAGSLGEGAEALYRQGFTALFSVVPGPVSLEEALERAALNLRSTARDVAATLRLGRVLGQP